MQTDNRCNQICYKGAVVSYRSPVIDQLSMHFTLVFYNTAALPRSARMICQCKRTMTKSYDAGNKRH